MELSSAEKQKQYRSRIDAEPARGQAYLEKEKLAEEESRRKGNEDCRTFKKSSTYQEKTMERRAGKTQTEES